MERSLYISKYRNIGLEKEEKLVLNNSLEKGKMGNLVILVGANNAGKSNVLDAIRTIDSNKFSTRDLTNLSFKEQDKHPKVSLVSTDGVNDYKITTSLSKTTYDYPGVKETVNFTFTDNLNEFNHLLNEFKLKFGKKIFNNRNLINNVDKIIELVNQATPNLEEIKKTTLDFMDNFVSKMSESKNNHYLWNEFKKEYANYTFIKEYQLKESLDDKRQVINELYNKSYGMNFIPSVYTYTEQVIKNSDITTSIKDLEENDFFLKLFSRINLSLEEIYQAYEDFNQSQNKGVLRRLEQIINEKLVDLSNDFNSLYFVSNDKYKFEVSLESNAIYLLLFRGTKDIILDYQSTGFRWFFDLYFNLLTKSNLKPGDILIMDEPATNLHVQGQVELRKFLKDFAIKNDLTIVIATHSPFLIDIDNLDELRVIENKDNQSSITNNFTSYNNSDADSLRVIKNALTCERNVLYNPDSQVIFVSGIAAYNYLIAFKKLLNLTDEVVFLPVGSLGDINDPKLEQTQTKISKELIKIRRYNPLLLTSNNSVAKAMKKLNENDSNLKVVNLDEIDQNFSDIESLFSYEDLLNANLLNLEGQVIHDNKASSLLKNHLDLYHFSDETLNNFKKLFRYLEIE